MEAGAEQRPVCVGVSLQYSNQRDLGQSLVAAGSPDALHAKIRGCFLNPPLCINHGDCELGRACM